MTDDDLICEVQPYTKTGPERMAAMIGGLRFIDSMNIVGDVVECGVWRAGNIILARRISPERLCWLYDTFTGMTEPGPEDKSRSSGKSALPRYNEGMAGGQGWCVSLIDDVKACLSETHSFDEQRLRFVVGDVAETLLDPENVPDRIALLRLDTDWYASTKVELEVLYPRLASGGVLIVDDYGHWAGARRAVDEFFTGQKADLRRIDYTAVMMIKP